MVCISFFAASSLSSGETLKQLVQGISLLTQQHTTTTQSVPLTGHTTFVGNASQHLARISQLDPAQYSSRAEFDTWAYSACSTASMTEVFDAYGGQYRITDVLRVESQLGEITPDQGLVRPEGIAITAAQFGFKTEWRNDWSLDQIISIANSGKPVIVGFPPDRYEGGHLLVLIGGDSQSVFLADTSLWNRKQISRDQFLQWWGGFGAVVTPK